VHFDSERVLLERPNGVYRSVLDERTLTAASDGSFAVSELFANAPLAVLVPAGG